MKGKKTKLVVKTAVVTVTVGSCTCSVDETVLCTSATHRHKATWVEASLSNRCSKVK